jgi:hypothetical protein
VNIFIGSRLVEVATPADALKAQQNPIETLTKLDAALAAIKPASTTATDALPTTPPTAK